MALGRLLSPGERSSLFWKNSLCFSPCTFSFWSWNPFRSACTLRSDVCCFPVGRSAPAWTSPWNCTWPRASVVAAPPCPQSVHTAEGIWGADGGGEWGVQRAFCPPSRVHPGGTPTKARSPVQTARSTWQSAHDVRPTLGARRTAPLSRGDSARVPTPQSATATSGRAQGRRPASSAPLGAHARCGLHTPRAAPATGPAWRSSTEGRSSTEETAPQPHAASECWRGGGCSGGPPRV